MNVNLGFSTDRDVDRGKVTYIWIILNPAKTGPTLGGDVDKGSLKARGKGKVQKYYDKKINLCP